MIFINTYKNLYSNDNITIGYSILKYELKLTNKLGSTPTKGFNIVTPGYCLLLFLGRPFSKDSSDGIVNDSVDSNLGFL